MGRCHDLMEARYLELSGLHCPKCGATNISGGSVDIQGGGAIQQVTCEACDASWHDCYTLTGMILEEETALARK
uniref:Uncharacterized protein n=1 Tax=viral metagenome TaxID=1070528 RepID=A0A6M3L594_9ZZZZ